MKLKYEFEVIAVEDEYRAVAIGENSPCGVLTMNESAAEIFGLLKQDTEVELLVTELLKHYPDESEDVIRIFVEKTIHTLEKAKLIE